MFLSPNWTKFQKQLGNNNPKAPSTQQDGHSKPREHRKDEPNFKRMKMDPSSKAGAHGKGNPHHKSTHGNNPNNTNNPNGKQHDQKKKGKVVAPATGGELLKALPTLSALEKEAGAGQSSTNSLHPNNQRFAVNNNGVPGLPPALPELLLSEKQKKRLKRERRLNRVKADRSSATLSSVPPQSTTTTTPSTGTPSTGTPPSSTPTSVVGMDKESRKQARREQRRALRRELYEKVKEEVKKEVQVTTNKGNKDGSHKKDKMNTDSDSSDSDSSSGDDTSSSGSDDDGDNEEKIKEEKEKKEKEEKEFMSELMSKQWYELSIGHRTQTNKAIDETKVLVPPISQPISMECHFIEVGDHIESRLVYMYSYICIYVHIYVYSLPLCYNDSY